MSSTLTTAAALAALVNEGEGRKFNVLGHDFSVILRQRLQTWGNAYVFEVVTPPGLFVPPHAQEHEDEYGYIIEGEFEVYMDGQMQDAQAGSVLYFPKRTVHGMRNIGSTPSKMVWVSTPGANVDASFEELAALPAGGPPDMGKLVALFAKYDMQLLPPPPSWL